MSASLVGSEMCIRDSGCTQALRLHRARREKHISAPHPAPRLAPPRQDASCLLYTSDAADDM
eukprot:13750889-Alexandrium_andersonii.AAC.1